MAAQPQHLGGGPAGLEAHLPGDLVAPLISEFLPQGLRLVARPVVHPHNGVAQGLALLVQAQEGLSLRGEGQRNLILCKVIRLYKLLQAIFEGGPIGLRRHLHKVYPGGKQRVLLGARSKAAPFFVKGRAFEGGGADINAQKGGHSVFSFRRGLTVPAGRAGPARTR
ncbi:hypothetical protein SDC9_111326 [bioreactor metagenome]|uniref:Uncharacterized protein n=1 Tax=bioreactor metagenome TaxID=1076179 RepID=A0A645BG77_9ZZZZ